ncbi:MAG: FAD-binding protein [Chloroflexota bacterium]|nr:FAD-binding protein [Chloroflexota bacterium]
MDQVQELVRTVPKLRVLGSRHSFNDLADTLGDQISLARMPRLLELDSRARTVTIDGAVRYGELCGPLDAAGFALHNLASLPHISAAGACATSTHGSGDRNGSLATAVAAMEVVTATGEIRGFSRASQPDEFDGAVVSLGGLGVVTKLKLQLQPTFQVRQYVYDDLPLAQVVDHFDAITSSAYSVSLFTQWRGQVFDQVWLKHRVTDGEAFEPPGDFFGATIATTPRHPIPGMSPAACTDQLGVAGPWYERLPHFRMDHTPSSGDELQSEYQVPRRQAVDALLAIDALRDRISPLAWISEIRTIAADDLWMSPSFGRDSVAIHFTWKPDWDAVRGVLRQIEEALAPFEARPHWGKLFTIPPDQLGPRYPKREEFAALLHRHDPLGKFRNEFLERYL